MDPLTHNSTQQARGAAGQGIRHTCAHPTHSFVFREAHKRAHQLEDTVEEHRFTTSFEQYGNISFPAEMSSSPSCTTAQTQVQFWP
jgi:hypothetical protein